MLEVLQDGDFFLNEPVSDYPIDELKTLSKYQSLIDSMIEVCREMKGMGLSANQVGKSLRFFIMMDLETREFEAYFNPRIIEGIGRNRDLEGCLSFRNPEVMYYVRRKQNIKLGYTDINGEQHIKEFIGLPARCVQHEIDHLNGITMKDIGKLK